MGGDNVRKRKIVLSLLLVLVCALVGTSSIANTESGNKGEGFVKTEDELAKEQNVDVEVIEKLRDEDIVGHTKTVSELAEEQGITEQEILDLREKEPKIEDLEKMYAEDLEHNDDSLMSFICPKCGKGKLIVVDSGCSGWVKTGKQRLCTHGKRYGVDIECDKLCYETTKCDSCFWENRSEWHENKWECRGFDH